MVLARPETVDRVVASIGNQAITLSDVEAEYRLELFLDGRFPDAAPEAATLARVCNRLIEQKLLVQDIASEGAQAADPPHEARAALEAVQRKYPTEEAYQSALRALGLNQSQLIERLADQERTLQIIDERFRPAAWPEQTEIESYYRGIFLPEYARRNAGSPPALAAVEEQIRQILVQENIDRLLDKWLRETKTSHRVKVYGF